MVVTSRERLNLGGEWIYEIRGMDIPFTAPERDFDEYSAVRLFVQSAKQADPELSLRRKTVLHHENLQTDSGNAAGDRIGCGMGSRYLGRKHCGRGREKPGLS